MKMRGRGSRLYFTKCDTDLACKEYSNKRVFFGRETSRGLFWNLGFLATLLLAF